MKKNRPKKKGLGKKAVAFVIMRVLLSATAFAVDPHAPPPPKLEQMTEMRAKQEQEENSVTRVIQQPMMLQTQQVCTPVEQTRQRIRDLADNKETKSVNVEGSFGDNTIESSSGATVNQIVELAMPGNNERNCL